MPKNYIKKIIVFGHFLYNNEIEAAAAAAAAAAITTHLHQLKKAHQINIFKWPKRKFLYRKALIL